MLNKYPIKDFLFEKIDEIKGEKSRDNQDKLVKLEQHYLNKYYEDTLCINHDKNARPIYSEDFVNRKIQRQKRKDKIKKLSKITPYVCHINKCDKPKRSLNHKDMDKNKKQVIAEGLRYHKNKTKEQEQKRRDNVRKAMVAKLKPIEMYDLDGNYIGIYESKRHIIREHPSLYRHCITNVLTGKANQHKGYKFVYKIE